MKKKIVGIVVIVAILLAAISVMAVPAQATQNLRITNHNLNTLNSFTYSGAWYNVGANSYLLKWYGGGQYFEPPWKAPALAPAPYTDKITATIMADYGGNYWGECVSMVKNLAHNTVITDNWTRGRRVMNGGISSGTAIATFVWDSKKGRYVYPSSPRLRHAAIFREYTYDSSHRINGMIVWDQNWYKNNKKPPEGIVAMHKISKTGSGISVSNANSYYVIQVP